MRPDQATQLQQHMASVAERARSFMQSDEWRSFTEDDQSDED